MAGETRNPKAEDRKKAEIRNPKSEDVGPRPCNTAPVGGEVEDYTLRKISARLIVNASAT
jgi:hypothetical protein